MSLLRLIRFPNLLIIALVQSILYFFLLLPSFHRYNIDPRLTLVQFVYLVAATLCITMCGYIVNDLYDHEADMLNRKDKVIIDVSITAQVCMWLYAVVGFIGLMLSIYVAFRIEQIYMAYLYVFSAGLLVVYTRKLKKMPLIGNLLVAFFCAGVAALIWLAEIPGCWELQAKAPSSAQTLQTIFIWYFSFAFLSTFFREIVKDIEDKIGDEAAGCRTYPIVAGDNAAKTLASVFATLLILLLLLLFVLNTPGFGTWFYLCAAIGVVFPLVYALYLLRQAQVAADYHQISFIAKMVMLAGILLLFFVKIT